MRDLTISSKTRNGSTNPDVYSRVPRSPFASFMEDWFGVPTFGLPRWTDSGFSTETPYCSDSVVETDTNYVVSIDMPGVKSPDVDVSLRDTQLSINWKRTGEQRAGQYSQSYTLPHVADNNAIDASLEDGVLTLKIGKKISSVSRKIEVKGKTKSV